MSMTWAEYRKLHPQGGEAEAPPPPDLDTQWSALVALRNENLRFIRLVERLVDEITRLQLRVDMLEAERRGQDGK